MKNIWISLLFTVGLFAGQQAHAQCSTVSFGGLAGDEDAFIHGIFVNNGPFGDPERLEIYSAGPGASITQPEYVFITEESGAYFSQLVGGWGSATSTFHRITDLDFDGDTISINGVEEFRIIPYSGMSTVPDMQGGVLLLGAQDGVRKFDAGGIESFDSIEVTSWNDPPGGGGGGNILSTPNVGNACEMSFTANPQPVHNGGLTFTVTAPDANEAQVFDFGGATALVTDTTSPFVLVVDTTRFSNGRRTYEVQTEFTGDGRERRLFYNDEYVRSLGMNRLVDAGAYHTCEIMSNRQVKCSGRNNGGQLGDNTTTNRSTPVTVKNVGGFGSLVATQVSAGGTHTCAIGTAGQLYCWGLNSNGQLGDGTTSTRKTPVQILSSGVTQVDCGAAHTLIVHNGEVKAFGKNNYGQLGDGTLKQRLTPVSVSGTVVDDPIKISTTYYHSCAVAADEDVWCWGLNNHGQLGDGGTTRATSPRPVTLANGATTIGAGLYHTCAGNESTGAIFCWGDGDDCALGGDTCTDSLTPVAVTGAQQRPHDIEAGRHTCVLNRFNEVECWGRGTSGQLGRDSLVSSEDPEVMSNEDNDSVSVAVGWYHSCTKRAGNDRAYCTGYNSYGQLGLGNTTNPIDEPTLNLAVPLWIQEP